MDETKLRAILHQVWWKELDANTATEAILALLPPKIPVYDPREVADRLGVSTGTDCPEVLDLELHSPLICVLRPF